MIISFTFSKKFILKKSILRFIFCAFFRFSKIQKFEKRHPYLKLSQNLLHCRLQISTFPNFHPKWHSIWIVTTTTSGSMCMNLNTNSTGHLEWECHIWMWLLLLLLSTGGFFGGSTWIWLKFCSIFKPKVILGEVFEAFLNTINFLRIFFQIFGDFPKKKLFFSSFLPKFSRKIRFFSTQKSHFFSQEIWWFWRILAIFSKFPRCFYWKCFFPFFVFFAENPIFITQNVMFLRYFQDFRKISAIFTKKKTFF